MTNTKAQDNFSQSVRDLLENRARKLAQEADKPIALTTRRNDNLYLGLRLLDSVCALPLHAVKEVINLGSVLPIPRTPIHVAGLVRLRGKILTLIDLRRFWYQSVSGHADSDRAVVIEMDGVEFGVLCSEVEELVELESDEIKDFTENLPKRLKACLRGLARRDMLVIDIQKLIAQRGFLVDSAQEES